VRFPLLVCGLLAAIAGPAAAQSAPPAARPGQSSKAAPLVRQQASATRKLPSAAPAGRARAPAQQDDQSYLFSNAPLEPGGPPSYVTSGSRPFNQPWYMSIYDTTGGWN
jgi:hypothetical protein